MYKEVVGGKTHFMGEFELGDKVLIDGKKYKIINDNSIIKITIMDRLIAGIVKGAMIIGICYGLVLLLQK